MADIADAGAIHIPWYATVFRGDRLETALAEIAPVALRYGARDYEVFRYDDDRYKFLQVAGFDEKAAFETYWQGPEFQLWRAQHQSYYQVPIIPNWVRLTVRGALGRQVAAAG